MTDEALLALSAAANLMAAYYWCKGLVWAVEYWRDRPIRATNE